MGIMRDCRARLPGERPKNNLSMKLEKLGFVQNNTNNYSKGGIIIRHVQNKKTNTFHWRYYTDFQNNKYLEFKVSSDLLDFVEQEYEKDNA